MNVTRPLPPVEERGALTVRSFGDCQIISAWLGDVELITRLRGEQVRQLIDALQSPACIVQILGQTHAFTAHASV